MRKLGYTEKQFYVGWFDANDVPMGLITGPFESSDQAMIACDALKPLHLDRRLVVLGGNMLRVPYPI
jgi:hypothetical protein